MNNNEKILREEDVLRRKYLNSIERAFGSTPNLSSKLQEFDDSTHFDSPLSFSSLKLNNSSNAPQTQRRQSAHDSKSQTRMRSSSLNCETLHEGGEDDVQRESTYSFMRHHDLTPPESKDHKDHKESKDAKDAKEPRKRSSSLSSAPPLVPPPSPPRTNDESNHKYTPSMSNSLPNIVPNMGPNMGPTMGPNMGPNMPPGTVPGLGPSLGLPIVMPGMVGGYPYMPQAMVYVPMPIYPQDYRDLQDLDQEEMLQRQRKSGEIIRNHLNYMEQLASDTSKRTFTEPRSSRSKYSPNVRSTSLDIPRCTGIPEVSEQMYTHPQPRSMSMKIPETKPLYEGIPKSKGPKEGRESIYDKYLREGQAKHPNRPKWVSKLINFFSGKRKRRS